MIYVKTWRLTVQVNINHLCAKNFSLYIMECRHDTCNSLCKLLQFATMWTHLQDNYEHHQVLQETVDVSTQLVFLNCYCSVPQSGMDMRNQPVFMRSQRKPKKQAGPVFSKQPVARRAMQSCIGRKFSRVEKLSLYCQQYYKHATNMSTAHCLAVNCNNRQANCPGLSFFRFPKNQVRYL